MLRATLGRPIIEHDTDIIPLDEISRGGRQARYPFMGAEFTDVTGWDISSAYAHTLATIPLPTRWKQYDGSKVPDVPSGFARAVVDIPFMFYGPLPVPIMLRGVEDAYPTSQIVSGVWTLDELRAAEKWGCRVMVESYWIGSRYVQPFLTWWKEYQRALNQLDESARNLLKMSANAMVGQFAASGMNGKHWYDNGILTYAQPTGKLRPASRSLHALVVGRVRARLFDEALAPLAGFIVIAHTDGIFITGGRKPQPAGNKPGEWRIKIQTPSMIVIDAQTYSYENEDGERVYIAAGVPPKTRPEWFGRKVERVRKKQGMGAIRNPSPAETKRLLMHLMHR